MEKCTKKRKRASNSIVEKQRSQKTKKTKKKKDIKKIYGRTMLISRIPGIEPGAVELSFHLLEMRVNDVNHYTIPD